VFIINLFDFPDDFKYILDNLGQSLYINNNLTKALLTSVNLDENFTDYYISTNMEINSGDLIDHLNSKWLILSHLEGQTIRSKAYMRKCNYEIKFNFQGVIKTFPSIIQSKTFSIEEDKYFSLPDGEIQVTLQANAETENITVDDRFIKMGSPWKVTGIDRTHIGLLIINCSLDQFSADDNKELEIADYGKYTYSVTINNPAPINLVEKDTRQLDITVTVNDGTTTESVENASLIYQSDSENVCTVSDGIITAVGAGTATVTVSLDSEYYSASDSITVNIEEVIQDNYTISIFGPDSITIGSSASYTATIYNNGVETTGSVSWSLSNGNASITSSDGSSCTVQAGNTSGVTVDLTATLDSDNTVTEVKTLNITALW